MVTKLQLGTWLFCPEERNHKKGNTDEKLKLVIINEINHNFKNNSIFAKIELDKSCIQLYENDMKIFLSFVPFPG